MTALGARAADALLELLQRLKAEHYHFIVTTPATHDRVTSRPDRQWATDRRDIFGWNLPFAIDRIPPDMLALLVQADALIESGTGYRSRFRVARLGDKLFLHSSFPTEEPDAVFFGPDSYRFARFLGAELPRVRRARRVVDLGTGTGVGAITAAALLPGARLIAIDSNASALDLARINAKAAGLEVELIEGSGLTAAADPIDLVIANPPFLLDRARRAYRHGGAEHGAQLTTAWALEAAARLASGGHMLLYSGSAIVGGRDLLRQTLIEALPSRGCTLRYEELDPDIFGEELLEPGYDDVERIAAIAAVITRA